MKILITGGFGSIGVVVLKELLHRGHEITVFEIETKRTKKLKNKFTKFNVHVLFGDIKNYNDVSSAIEEQDVVLHMAAMLPPLCNQKPELCMSVNIGGTENLIKALKSANRKIGIIYVSSASVMGPTQDNIPPVKPNDKLVPTDIYSKSKITSEKLIEESGLQFCILRLAAVLPTVLNITSLLTMIKLFFDMPLEARCEVVIDIDVATALATSSEKLKESKEIEGMTAIVAGGKKNGCQMKTKDLVNLIFQPIGLRSPENHLFSEDLNSYYLDWYDTKKIESILQYQNHSIKQWQEYLHKRIHFIIPIIKLFKKPIMKYIEKQSPNYNKRVVWCRFVG